MSEVEEGCGERGKELGHGPPLKCFLTSKTISSSVHLSPSPCPALQHLHIHPKRHSPRRTLTNDLRGSRRNDLHTATFCAAVDFIDHPEPSVVAASQSWHARSRHGMSQSRSARLSEMCSTGFSQPAPAASLFLDSWRWRPRPSM